MAANLTFHAREGWSANDLIERSGRYNFTTSPVPTFGVRHTCFSKNLAGGNPIHLPRHGVPDPLTSLRKPYKRRRRRHLPTHVMLINSPLEEFETRDFCKARGEHHWKSMGICGGSKRNRNHFQPSLFEESTPSSDHQRAEKVANLIDSVANLGTFVEEFVRFPFC